MEKLKTLIEQFGRWRPLQDYILRIETYDEKDISFCVENAKALLESIAKEICKERKQPYTDEDGTGKLLNLAFASLGYEKTDVVRQVSGSIANIGQRMGDLRNKVGATAHGKTMIELEERNTALDASFKDFLIQSTELIACLLIELFEVEFPRRSDGQPTIKSEDEELFTQYWDDYYGVFEMGDYSYPASEIFSSVDPQAYKSELKLFVDGLE